LALSIEPTTLYAFERASMLVPLPHLEIEPRITILGEEWERKVEFHVTAAHTPTIADRLRRSGGMGGAEAEDAAWAAIRDASNECRVGAVILDGERRVVREGGERTIVEMCDVEGIGELYAWLSEHVRAELEAPPTHVTLYTAPGGEAIGLHTAADLERLTTPLSEQG
jgi:hypothetical protein